ncbi:MAG: hypothetical protein Q7S76_02230, partial [bacterium]|nr:hypothetical protein [bacterium]
MRTAGADRGSHGFVRRILVPAGGLVSVLILVCLLFYSFFPLPNRLSVLFIGNPMVLAFWDGGFRDTLLLVPIDSDVTVSSLYGYGDYSLASLWKLGRIEKKGGLLLTTSLEEALGLPIPWFFGPKTESLPPDFDTSGGVPTAWELLRFLNPLTASSNIPMTVRIALWRILASKGGQTEILSFDEKNVYADKQNPDGSTIRILDPDRVENALGTRFEDDRI